ncbi:MAG: GGDEF domain-containing protein [Ruminococcus sp.]|nr:GGDEF domain-containing protein [Ruminococcus sp.]
MHRTSRSFITVPIIIILILTVAASTAMGIMLIMQSKSAMKELINHRMLDVSNAAASFLDGDQLEYLDGEDKGAAYYQYVYDTLKRFQDSIGLAYIYCVRKDAADQFVFLIDPSEPDPGEPGEPVKYTEALQTAWEGRAAVDEEPYSDEWGRFYSSYTPVKNSAGQVTCVVASDFRADWYEDQINKHTMTVFSITAGTTVIAALLLIALSSRLRYRFRLLYSELNSLSDNVKELNELIIVESGEESPAGADIVTEKADRTDEISELARHIEIMQKDLKRYIVLVNAQAYTDEMTGVNNKAAYINLVRSFDRRIEGEPICFAVAVFDINGLKVVNDNYGHELGDMLIIGAASCIKEVFGADNVYRIGGDEFIAIVEDCTLEKMNSELERLDSVIDRFNSESSLPEPLSLSKGADVFVSGGEKPYRLAFKQADQAMYSDKEEFYRKKRASAKETDAQD